MERRPELVVEAKKPTGHSSQDTSLPARSSRAQARLTFGARFVCPIPSAFGNDRRHYVSTQSNPTSFPTVKACPLPGFPWRSRDPFT
jgi:hypothetical protein